MSDRKIHMRDQIPNRVVVVMGEERLSLKHYFEECCVCLLLVAVFFVGVGF